MDKLTAEQREMLTDEELEGMDDEDLVDEGLEGEEGEEDGENGAEGADAAAGAEADADKAALEAANGEEGAGDDEADKAQAAAAAAAAAEAAQPEAQAGQEKPQTETQEPQERAPSWRIDPAVPDKIKALDEERDKIIAQFDDGEMTGAEMRAKLKPLESEMKQLETKVMAADIAKTNAIDHYKDVTIPTFFAAHAEYQPGSILYAMLDAEVKRIQQTATNPLSPKILEQAHTNLSSQVEKAYGVKKTATPKTPDPKAKTDTTVRQVPPTLGNVPAADGNEADDGGEFAWLDRLANSDIEKYETELAKLPEEKRERYMAE